jgi:hypothetical protein
VERYHNSVALDEHYVYTCNNDSIIALEKETVNIYWFYEILEGELPDLSAGAIAIADSFLCFSVWPIQIIREVVHA